VHRLKKCWIFPLGKNCFDEDNIIDDAVGPTQGNGPVGSGNNNPTSSPTSIISETPSISELSATPASEIFVSLVTTQSPIATSFPTSIQVDEVNQCWFMIFPINKWSSIKTAFQPKCPSGNTTITFQNLHNVPRQKVEIDFFTNLNIDFWTISSQGEQTSAEEKDRLCNMEGFQCETNKDCGKNRKCCEVKFRKHSISSFVGPFFGACKICLFLWDIKTFSFASSEIKSFSLNTYNFVFSSTF